MKTVLVIDDDPHVAGFVSSCLTAHGRHAVVALDGESAVVLAKTLLPDLVLSDVNLPGMNGVQVLKALRSQAETASIPVIMMTGGTHDFSVRQAMTLGADDYLAKPFSLSELMEAVNSRLDRFQRLRDASETKMAQLRSTLGASLPHELLTPLCAIIGFSELMATGFDTITPSEILQMATQIQQSGEHLHRVIRNYLWILQLDAIVGDPAALTAAKGGETRSAKDVIEAAARETAQRWSRPDDLVLELIPGPVRLKEEYLKKAAEEIADNAFKFSKSGTPVLVSMTGAEDGVRVRIKDAGRGMAPDQTARVGEFCQFDRKQHEKGGLGVGLAIARRLVELGGGGLAIESEPNVGTTVEIAIPARNGAVR
jgi:signal transduction histidine kinase